MGKNLNWLVFVALTFMLLNVLFDGSLPYVRSWAWYNIVSYTRSETIVIERVARLFFFFYDVLNHAKG
jgi:hypothetical protein